MFERNDKALRTWRICAIVATAIFAVAVLALGIALAVIIHGALILITPVGWLFCWALWLWARLHMSYLCDIKLIRNKLYGESNEYLEDFLKSYGDRVAELGEQEQKEEEKEAELAHLYQLMNSGVITPEEYEMRKNELATGE